MNKIAILFSFLAFFSELSAKDAWESFKKETVLQMAMIPGWCSEEKALLIMDIIKENAYHNCIEIGVYAGKSLYPIAKALQYNGSGKVYGIDAWDPIIATNGFLQSDPNYQWWSQLDYEKLYKNTQNLIKYEKLFHHCILIRESSQIAAETFDPESIDFIHFDGNHNENDAFQDVSTYLSKIKDGGYIMLNDPNWYCMVRTLVFLLERTDIASPFNASATYLLVRRNKQREQYTSTLLYPSAFKSWP